MGTEKDEKLWLQDNDEGYWQAVLEQGHVAPPLFASPSPIPENWQSTPDWLPEKSNSRGNGSVEDASSFLENWEKEWQYLQQCYDQGETLELVVESYNRGGLLVKYEDIRGFIPASQLADIESQIDPSKRESYLSSRVGDALTLKVIELDEKANHVIFSERAAKWQGRCPERILQEIQPGDICRGRVSNLCEFGAFVDLGGVDGLIHVSELSWQRVDHPHDLLEPGQEIEVYVMDVDHKRKRVALSLKRLRPDPWFDAEDRYHVGQLVSGVVTNVVDFGAFVQVEDGLEGLVHISELAEGNFLHPRNVVQEDDVITARIMHIDSVAHRLGLSLRRAHDESLAAEQPVGDVFAAPQ